MLLFKLIYSVPFWLCWVFIAMCRLLIAAASLIAENGLWRVWAQYLWYTGLVALQHVGSSWTRDGTRVPCTGRQIINYWVSPMGPF